MRSKRFIIILIIGTLFISSGCTSILEGDKIKETLHSAQPYERPPEVKVEVSDYDELKDAVLDFVMQHESSGEIVYNYDGDDVKADVDRACDEIMHNHPFGAFAVSDITGLTIKIGSYFEVDISIEYKRTKQQMEHVNIVNVSTQRYLRSELLSVMSGYLDEAVFRTTLNITAEDITAFVSETYYQNPRSIVMLPVTAVGVFPPNGEDRIFELHFGYVDRPDILSQYSSSLTSYVRRNALAADGENDVEILISLAANLIAACVYDEGMARAISEHGAQNFAATAYGALVKASAVGEGFAMAYKALCDELGFDCRVVLGYHDGMVHAWNIISLYGYNYHIDVAMCALNGIETAFLKSDADFLEHYSWDIVNTIRCNGPLTYEDFVEVEIPEETNGEQGEEAGDETGGEPGDATDEGTGEEASGEAGEDITEPADIPELPEENYEG